MTVIELLTAMTILGTILASLTIVFVTASAAELDQNRRFQAQLNSRLSLDKIRREVHCASSISTTGTSPHVYMFTEVMPSQCVYNGGSDVSWCAVQVTSTRYQLYRKVGDVCNSTGTRWADYLTTDNLFSYTAQSTTSLAKLHVDFPVNLRGTGLGSYELIDDIYLRNSARS